MATVIPIGEPVNDAERRTIAHLRDRLPSSYLLVHNFELKRSDERFEVDLAILAPHAVYLVDIKGTRGLIDVHGPRWYPEGRQPFTSPLLKLRSHAKTLKGIITDSHRERYDLQKIYVDAVVVLAATDALLQDSGGRDAPDVVHIKKAAAFFQNASRIPGRFSRTIGALHSIVLKGLQGVARPRTGPLRLGSWEVEERLGGGGKATWNIGRETSSLARARARSSCGCTRPIPSCPALNGSSNENASPTPTTHSVDCPAIPTSQPPETSFPPREKSAMCSSPRTWLARPFGSTSRGPPSR